jgi:lipid II:glycine glycyltransferase (peptidoglycan interpeptide bridge formation enzyme)
VVRRGAYRGTELVGVYTGHVEPARRGIHMEIVGGPIMDWRSTPVVDAVFADMKSLAAQHACVYVRIRPQLIDSSAHRAIFTAHGCKKAPMYLSVELAGVLDLSKPEDEILQGMRQRLRRALRKAEKNNITVETGTDPKDIKEFYRIQLETAGRHQFVAFSEDFLTKQFDAFAGDNSAVLYTAKHEGQILAQNFIIFYGNEASYHYGVSTELGTKLSGAPLLHMQAMRDARARGIRRYNFWGIVDEEDTGHRFYGVSVFKRGFGVDELRYVPAHDLIVKQSSYLKTKLIEATRRKLRRV